MNFIIKKGLAYSQPLYLITVSTIRRKYRDISNIIYKHISGVFELAFYNKITNAGH